MSKNVDIPYIFDIQHGSTADGPGLRTTIFVKGCNLRCAWCHNPEGQNSEPELALFVDKCIKCNVCNEVCNNEKCLSCGQCVKFCAAGARKLYGKRYRISELIDDILADKVFYDAVGGGVTVSGGECMLYPEFLAELFYKCKQACVSTAVDTAGNVPWKNFEQVLPFTDLFLYDIKALDPELHKRGTSVDNALILDNLERLHKNGCQLIIRVPVIPGFNEGAEIERIKEYVSKLGLEAEYLKYHTFGESKFQALRAARLIKKY